MCNILPISHIPCTHTIAIWQHCIEATRSSLAGITPCWNVKQHEQAVLTRRPCEDCSGQRWFARRGGVADRGNGSPLTGTTNEDNDRPITPPSNTDDDADDSGYHSDVIPEEASSDECPLSPKAVAPRTKPRKHHQRSLTRKPSWTPNLKRDLNFSFEYGPRRESIDSLLDAQYTTMAQSSENYALPTRQMRGSTLLHPSSPSPPPLEKAQIAQAFPFPKVVEVRKSVSATAGKQVDVRPRKNSTLLHPSEPDQTERPRARRDSSLLHPSDSTTGEGKRAGNGLAEYRTVISVPPRYPPHTRSTTSPPSSSSNQLPLRRMPHLQSTQSEPQSWTMAQRRRRSVLHSCLSDDEDGNDRDGYSGGGGGEFTFSRGRATWAGFEEDNSEEVEEYMLRRSAECARLGRQRG
jgi:hypothetical protein